MVAKRPWEIAQTCYQIVLEILVRYANTIVKRIAQFRYFKIQPQTIDMTMKLWGINPTDSILYSPEPRAEVYCLRLILIYRNWAICR